MASQPLDDNYKPILTDLYDPSGTQFVSPQAGLVKTGTDNTLYAAQLFSPVDGARATYAASITALAPASSATDIFTITGSATKLVRITRLRISGIKTTAGADVDIQLIKRSTANTAGTSTSPTIVPYDSDSAAATAVVKAYTANPSALGTAVGTLAVDSLWVALATAQTGVLDYTFGNRPAQAVVLRAATEVLAVNLNAATVGGGAFDIWCEFTEESLT